MNQTPGEIDAHIEHTREDLALNLRALEAKVRSMADWRAFLRRHPGLVLGLVIAAAIVLGSGRARSRRN